MDESVSYIHSTGAVICVSAICLAFVVSYLALKSRGRVNHRGFNHVSGSISVPLCKVCHQLVKNAPSQGQQTKEWTCSDCSGYSHSAEVSPSSHGDDQSADLEIQCTLGSLAISHTNTPQSRDSPRSWLHLIEDLNLLPDQASNQNDPLSEANNEIDDESVIDFNISSSVTTSVSDVGRSTTANSYTKKPLIQPAKLRVRKRQFSISSATAALSLTGNGWGFNDHVTNKADARTRVVNGEAPNPFLRVPDTHRHMNDRRNSAVVERQKVNLFQQGSISFHKLSSLANGNGLTSHRMTNNPRISLRDSHESLSLSRLNNFSNAHPIPTPHTPHQHQYPSLLSITSSPLPCPSNQPQSTGAPAAAPINNSTSSQPHGNGVRCVVGALILFSVTGNVVLLLLLFVYVYKPSSALSLWVDDFLNL